VVYLNIKDFKDKESEVLDIVARSSPPAAVSYLLNLLNKEIR
jgi:hypothetical protein